MTAHLFALTAVVLWGISFVATKAALAEITPITLIFTRFAMGVALLFLVLAHRRLPFVPPRDNWSRLAAMGLVGVFVHHLLQAHGLTLTTAVKTGWLVGLVPIWTALLSAWMLRERIGPGKAIGLLIGFAGALLVISGGRAPDEALTLPATRGDLLILAGTLNWAFYTVLGNETLKRLGAARATAGSMAFGWLLLVPVFVAAGGWREYASLSVTGWVAVVFLGIGCSGLGYLCWYAALARQEASKVAVYLYLEPPITLTAAVLLLAEPVSALGVGGGLLVLLGVLVVQRQ